MKLLHQNLPLSAARKIDDTVYIQDENGDRYFFEFYDDKDDSPVSVGKDAGGGLDEWCEAFTPSGSYDFPLNVVVMAAYRQHCKNNQPMFNTDYNTPNTFDSRPFSYERAFKAIEEYDNLDRGDVHAIAERFHADVVCDPGNDYPETVFDCWEEYIVDQYSDLIDQ